MLRFIFLIVGIFGMASTGAALIPAGASAPVDGVKRNIGEVFSDVTPNFGKTELAAPDHPFTTSEQTEQVTETETAPENKTCMVTPGGTVEVERYLVTDGDTLRVWGGGYINHPVRLVGIDAPETSQPYGIEAKDNLEALLTTGEEVQIAVRGIDKYERILADVCLDGASLNVQQVADGMAYTYMVTHLGDNSFRARLEYAQRQAKREGVGVHACSDCVAPHEYRKANPR